MTRASETGRCRTEPGIVTQADTCDRKPEQETAEAVPHDTPGCTGRPDCQQWLPCPCRCHEEPL